MEQIPQQQREIYTVAWICTLPIEATAAEGMLDVQHDYISVADGAIDHYRLGLIGEHGIVIAKLKNRAGGGVSTVGAVIDLLRSFPNVRFGLMVGLGGGVPALPNIGMPEDIRLGDVVVSDSSNRYGELVHYDLVNGLERGILHNTSLVLRKAVARLRADALEEGGYQIKLLVDRLVARFSRDDFSYPGEAADKLFASDYVHFDSEGDCTQCEEASLVQREQRKDSAEPKVHYGSICSTSLVLKDPVRRDELYTELGTTCFVAEAEEFMNNFPCLIVRGICDYCDSHRNNQWQPYAAATAAAYTKQLLNRIYPKAIAEQPLAQETMKLDPVMSQMPSTILSKDTHIQLLQLVNDATQAETGSATLEDLQVRRIYRWLTAPDSEIDYRTALMLRQPGTTSWLLISQMYLDWRHDRTRHVWLFGKPGCGKSIAAATIVEDIRKHCQHDTYCGMFFFTFSDSSKQSYKDCLRSLVQQLVVKGPVLSSFVQAFETAGKDAITIDLLEFLLVTAIDSYSKVFVVLDALDECPEAFDGAYMAQENMLHGLTYLSSRTRKLKILATSRDLASIRNGMEKLGARAVSMDTGSINRDILEFTEVQLRDDPILSNLDFIVKEEIKALITSRADGMFRWAYLCVQQLKSIQFPRADSILEALKTFPQSLDEAYERILSRIDRREIERTHTILRWLCYAARPLTPAELVEAIRIDVYAGDISLNPLYSVDDVWQLPSELVMVIRDNTRDTIEQDEDSNSSGEESSNSNSDRAPEDSSHYSQPVSHTTRIRLSHFSLKEYLESTRIFRTSNHRFSLVSDRENKILGHSCLIYLTQWANSTSKTLDRTDLHRFPFLSYAAKFWFEHYKTQPHGDYSYELSFFKNRRLVETWIRAYDPDWVWYDFFESPRRESTGSNLYYSSLLGLFPVTRALLGTKDLDAQGGKYGTALQAALYRRHNDIAVLLLGSGANPNSRCGKYGGALQTAVVSGDYEMVRLCLQMGADVNLQGGKFGNPLHAASYTGNSYIIKLLIEDGANTQIPGSVYGNALQAAVHAGKEKVARLLLEDYAVDVNGLGGRHGTALQIAAKTGNKALVMMLLGAGADVNASGGYYGFALHAAAYHGFDTIVQLLVENGADVNARGGVYGTALRAAFSSDRSPNVRKVFDILISSGVTEDFTNIVKEWHFGKIQDSQQGMNRLSSAKKMLIAAQTERQNTKQENRTLQHTPPHTELDHGPVKEAIQILENLLLTQTTRLSEDNPELIASTEALIIAYALNSQVRQGVELLQSLSSKQKVLTNVNTTIVPASHQALARIYHLAKVSGIRVPFLEDNADNCKVLSEQEKFIGLSKDAISTAKEKLIPIKLPSLQSYFTDFKTHDRTMSNVRTTIRKALQFMHSMEELSVADPSGQQGYPRTSTKLHWICEVIDYLRNADFVQDRLSFLTWRSTDPQTAYMVPIFIDEITKLAWHIGYCEFVLEHHDKDLLGQAAKFSMKSAYTRFLAAIHMMPDTNSPMALTSISEYIVHLLELVILLYIQGHSCDTTFANSEGNFVHTASRSVSDIHCFSARAACLSRLFGDEPLWMLGSQAQKSSHKDFTESGTLDRISIAADICTFDDIWGPVSKVELEGLIVQYNVRAGSIVRWECQSEHFSALTGQSMHNCHFQPYNLLEEGSRVEMAKQTSIQSPDLNGESSSISEAERLQDQGSDTSSLHDSEWSGTDDGDIIAPRGFLSESPAELLRQTHYAITHCLLPHHILLIGMLESQTKLKRLRCTCGLTTFRSCCDRSGRLHHLSTREEHRSLELASIGASLSFQGVGLKADGNIKKIHAFFKDRLTDQWENYKETCDPRQLQVYGAVLFSKCTSNAVRCTILELFQTPSIRRLMNLFHESGQFQKNPEQQWKPFLDGDISGIIALWETEPQSRTHVVNLISRVLRNLSYSGLDPDRKEYNVLWYPDGSYSPSRVIFHPGCHTWIKTLRDGADTCALSVLSEDSFRLCCDEEETECCPSKDQDLRSCLETAMVLDIHSPPFEGKRICVDNMALREDGYCSVRLGHDLYRTQENELLWIAAPLYRLNLITALSDRHIICQWDPSVTRRIRNSFGLSQTSDRGHREKWEDGEDALIVHIRNSIAPGASRVVDGSQLWDAWNACIRLLYK